MRLIYRNEPPNQASSVHSPLFLTDRESCFSHQSPKTATSSASKTSIASQLLQAPCLPSVPTRGPASHAFGCGSSLGDTTLFRNVSTSFISSSFAECSRPLTEV